MFKLLETLNQIINEAIERRTPVLKAFMSDSDSKYASAVDLQHLPTNNVPLYGSRIVAQILSQFKDIDDIKFNTSEDGMFYKLSVLVKTKNGKLVTIEISQLSTNDLCDLKKIIYINFMRRKS